MDVSTKRRRTWFRSGAVVAALAMAGSGVLLALSPATSGAASTPIGAYTTKDAWSFLSVPTLHPPKLKSDRKSARGKLAKGDFLVANFPNVDLPGPMEGQSGPLILNSSLQPVWFKALPTDVVALDLKQQTYEGKQVLSWWQGVVTNTGATVTGTVVVVDQHYRTVAKLVGKDGWVISPHDVAISGHDAWVTSYRVLKHVDLSAYGGAKDGTLYDFGIQEYDLESGRLLYTWDAYKRVSLADSYQAPPPKPTVPWDAYHGNSVQLVRGGKFLVSMRNTWAVYMVDKKTSDIAWTLGGKSSTFTIPSKARFEWQHDVMLSSGGVLTAFDDNCCEISSSGTLGTPGGSAKGLVLKLDVKRHTAKLLHSYLHGADFDVAFTGSLQRLPNGNVLVGWGSKPYFSEYSKDGRMLLDAVLPGKDLSYRALFTADWVGKPDDRPTGTARKAHGKATVYASWNGATQVASWRVLAGRTAGHMTTVAKKAKSGFETAIHLRHSYKLFKVQALDAKGHVLRTSEAFMVPTAGYY